MFNSLDQVSCFTDMLKVISCNGSPNMFLKSIRIFRNLTKTKDTTETVCQSNSSEAPKQNFMKLCICLDMYLYRKCGFDLFKENFISLLKLNKNHFVYIMCILYNQYSIVFYLIDQYHLS